MRITSPPAVGQEETFGQQCQKGSLVLIEDNPSSGHNSMNEMPSAPSERSGSTTDSPRWPIYLVVAIPSGASAWFSLLGAAFSGNAAVVALSVLTSIVCFACALILVFHRRDVFAILLSFASAPIFYGAVHLYFETRFLRTEVVQKVAEISRLIAPEIKDPQPALDKAIQEGAIRKATEEDVRAFRNAYFEKKYTSKNLPIPVAEDALAVTQVDIAKAYVVLKKFTYPSGLLDKHRAVFFIPIGIPEPSGEIGHSASYDFGTLTVTCTAARTGGIAC